MSIHMLVSAAYLKDLDPATKLVLMAIADSADEHTREAAPGFPKLRAWSGRKRSQTTALVSQLETAGLIKRVEAGRLGRRAVYEVFPYGVPAIPHPTEVAARYHTAVDNPVDNPDGQGPVDRPLGAGEDPTRGQPTGPLHASTSVLGRERNTDVGDNRARTAPPPARSGFPGARPTAPDDDAQGRARRAKGAADQPCPRHPDQIVPCGRCAHRAATSDQDAIKAARRLAREGIAQHRNPTTDPTLEETP